MARERLQHLFLIKPPAEEKFTSIGSRGPEKNIPDRNRQYHSGFLSRKLQNAWASAEGEHAVAHVTRQGVYLEFKSDPGFDLMTKSLEDLRSRSRDNQVRLLNVRVETHQVRDKETGAPKSVETTYNSLRRRCGHEQRAGDQ